MSAMHWVYGVDLGSRRCGIGLVNADTGAYSHVACEWQAKGAKALPIGRLLMLARASTHRFCDRLIDDYPVATVCFERPTGRFPNPTLMMTGGAVVEGIAQATGRVPWGIAVKEWKKLTVGRGDASKDDVHDWAHGFGVRTDDQEQLDALGVAVAAAMTMYQFDPARLVPHPALREAA